MRRGETVSYEVPFETEKVKAKNLYTTEKSGLIYIHVLITPVGSQDEGFFNGYLVQVQDISERRRAEEQLQKEHVRLSGIIEGTNVGTWEWNLQTGETVFNERWADIVGYTLEELAPCTIKTWEHLVHPDDIEMCRRSLEAHIAGETEYYDTEHGILVTFSSENYLCSFDRIVFDDESKMPQLKIYYVNY